MNSIDCLVVGHFDTSLEELAARLRPSQSYSGGFSEIRTNSVTVGGKQLSYSELFGELSRASWGLDVGLNPFRAAHSGAIFLVNRLRRSGFSAETVNFVSNDGHELVSAIENLNPRIVAITTTFYVEPSPIQQLIGFIRATAPTAIIVVGGPFVVSRALKSPTSVLVKLESLGADALVFDTQGEQALLELVERVSVRGQRLPTAIANVVYWESLGKPPVIGNPVRESNSLPDNRVHWAEFSTELSPPLAFLRTARGCSFRCAFCNYPTMAGQYNLSEIDSVCEELEELASLGVRDVAFVDDTFNVPLPRFKKLMREITRRDLRFRWTSFFRCSNADEEAFDLMAEAGCEAVFLGIESGDPDVLKAMNKSARPENYARGIVALRKRDIMTMASYIFGFPGETEDSIRRTLEFMSENVSDFYNVQLYFHDSKAPIEAQRSNYEIVGSGYTWEHRSMDWRAAADWVEYAMSTAAPSIPIPLYGFSMWSLPYFRALGLSRESFKGFTSIAAGLFRQGLTGAADVQAWAPEFTRTIPLEQLRRSGLEIRPASGAVAEAPGKSAR
jgi:radical SAM PhpK family P-methyltransferase